MRVRFAGIELRNPILAASGTFGYGIEFEDIVSLERIGGLVTKGLSREPMAGNPAPRLIETASGMLNSIGLQNIGVQAFVEKKLPPLRKYPGCAIIANVFGYEVKDYVAVIEALNQADGIAAYEINASCPNTKHGGQVFGTDSKQLAALVDAARQAAQQRDIARPIVVKLSPNVTSIAEMARVAEQSGADALSLVNTFLGMAIDAKSRQPRIANITGGLSGPAIKPIALRMVYEAAKAVKIPVLGLGGIVTAEDAVEFLLAGATAVQVGTASYADPRAVERLVKGLEQWCTRHNIEKVAGLTGALEIVPKQQTNLRTGPSPNDGQEPSAQELSSVAESSAPRASKAKIW
ncbi:Dihydroorotate dehydrogenase, catalytic subunit [Acidisarcina polymorpha]|uniref:Dihydroorotate dehydrogenase n=1 Tax=Acidisarcina polymorpha TaxID=2211140 RepID=A0A2Z5FWE8_9BACT|nr:dihydroorotate dehydrogenase [Acidisarcina polymorpha]AXC10834.1 Dihydroorotate dehydrogenase, catalytic subunit [Acidisarcina polymorpha]